MTNDRRSKTKPKPDLEKKQSFLRSPVIWGIGGLLLAAIAYYFWPDPYGHLEEDFPSKGYRLLSTPSLTGGPGSLQGEDDQQVLWPVANLKLTIAPKPIAVGEVETWKQVSISAEGLQRLFGASANAAASNVGARAGAREKVSFKLVNPKGVQVTDAELTQPLLDIWPSRDKRLFQYKRFVIVQEAIMADGIEFTISRDSKFSALFSGPNSLMATTSPSGVTTQPAASTDGQRASAYTLKGMFSEPLYVFVKARNVSEADIERLGVKNAYAVGVAADFVERSVKPGEVVKKTVRGESVMLAQKNGPFGSVDSKPADVKVELPRGVELISSRAFWTTNGKESSKTATTPVRRGTVLAASGTLLGNDVSWGSRTWGELNLEVEYRVPSTSTDVKVVEQLQPSKVVTERQFVLPLPKDKPIPAELRVELQDVAVDDRKETVTLLSPAGNAKTSTAMALDGRFELALDVEKRTLTVTRKSSAAR